MRELRIISQRKADQMKILEGGSHTKVYLGEKLLVVPRHKEINERLARHILKEADSE